MRKQLSIAASLLVSAMVSSQAAVTYINSDITSSTHLSKLPAGDYYSLTNVVYVMPGASLTLDAGVLFKNSGDGSLAITRGAQFFVNGTKDEPVIFTSIHDDFATWREAANEWGSIAICGNGLISASHYKGAAVIGSDGVANSKQPDGYSDKVMEGLSAAYTGDTRPYYGGNNDCDDSGSIKYLSIRYGGQISSLPNKELNGLSLGAVGQGTDIDYIEIMNNVDDGIEIWGGKVHLKHVSIWNVGDDSFDIDEGWRGQAQFGLIVQGYSLDASQGSGVGDNMFEHDGAEDSDAQPVTSGQIYNFTAIGNPEDGDGATAWRDGCRMQYRNCIIMDCAEKVVRPDGDDGDGANGYGYNGTLTMAEVFSTDATHLRSNSIGVSPQSLYTAQDAGKMSGFENCIFYHNANYAKFDEFGQTNAVFHNIIEPASMPIKKVIRGPIVTKHGKDIAPVISLDPCAAHDAAVAGNAKVVPRNGFYDAAPFVGGFSANNNWLVGWTAADQFGLVDHASHSAPAATITTGAAISFPTQAGVWYTVQSATDAAGPWSNVADVLGNGQTMSYVDSNLGTTGFFKVVYK
jgi:hypothetical protein